MSLAVAHNFTPTVDAFSQYLTLCQYTHLMLAELTMSRHTEQVLLHSKICFDLLGVIHGM